MKSVILVGMLGPYLEDPVGVEIWGCSSSYRHQPNLTKLYNLDPLAWFQKHRPEYLNAVNSGDFAIVMQRHYEEIPRSEALPRLEILKHFGLYDPREPLESQSRAYFTSTLCWMFADAIRQGYDEITLHRLQEDGRSLDYPMQKACLDFWLGMALGRGVKVTKSQSSLVGVPHPWEPGQYGYTMNPNSDTINATIASAIKAIARLPIVFEETETKEKRCG